MGLFFVRSDLSFRLERSSRHFRFLYVFWVDFGTKCVNWFRFLYVFGSNLVQSAELFDGFCSPTCCFELQSAESCASVTARLKRSATIIIEVWQHA